MKTFKESVLGDEPRGEWDLHDNFPLDHNPCEGCGGKCCVGMYLDQGPVIEGLSEDAMRWAEAHDGVEIYATANGRWGVKIPDTRCKHLNDDGECSIHDDRPLGCKRYYGMNPDGPMEGCALFKALAEVGEILVKREWAETEWPDGPPEKVRENIVDEWPIR